MNKKIAILTTTLAFAIAGLIVSCKKQETNVTNTNTGLSNIGELNSNGPIGPPKPMINCFRYTKVIGIPGAPYNQVTLSPYVSPVGQNLYYLTPNASGPVSFNLYSGPFLTAYTNNPLTSITGVFATSVAAANAAPITNRFNFTNCP